MPPLVSPPAPPRRTPLRPGTGDVLGTKYRLERRIGAGSMGEVWFATHVALDLPVAVKLLHDDCRDERTEALKLGLVREARVAASMSHPAVVRVFDVGRTFRGDPYIVMERLEGEDLREKLSREGRMGAREAVRILLPLIDAIQSAHLRGLVHRDVKPENVLLTRDAAGRTLPKLVDFGIAALRWIDEVHALAGTPDYMAPEQLEDGATPDHRVDTWALAVMLHEMLSGRAPFEAPTLSETFRRISAGEPNPLPASVDGRLAAIVMQALSRDPSQRPRCARELGESLARWLLARGVTDDASGQSIASTWFGEVEMSPTCDTLEALSIHLSPSLSASAPAVPPTARPARLRPTLPADTTATTDPAREFRVPPPHRRPGALEWPPRVDHGWERLTVGVVAIAAGAIAVFAVWSTGQGRTFEIERRIEARLSVLFQGNEP